MQGGYKQAPQGRPIDRSPATSARGHPKRSPIPGLGLELQMALGLPVSNHTPEPEPAMSITISTISFTEAKKTQALSRRQKAVRLVAGLTSSLHNIFAKHFKVRSPSSRPGSSETAEIILIKSQSQMEVENETEILPQKE